jgi:hypothetical protein
LQEKGDYLVFQPLFSYQGFEIKTGDKDEVIVPDGDKVLIVHRIRKLNNSSSARWNCCIPILSNQKGQAIAWY